MANKSEMTVDVQQALDSQPHHSAGLTALVGRLFHCMYGPERAYFEFPYDRLGPEHVVVRIVYSTWGYTAPRGPDAERLICCALWEDFKRAYSHLANVGYWNSVLFWRLSPELVWSQSDDRVKVRTRLAIPGLRLDSYEGFWPEGGQCPNLGVASAAQSQAEVP